ncbi:carbohydrate ABC transporter permease [Treponema parvum]|uniref:Carbohydrate ABC transporter permease n=1 Tax=Treponema parvum TaxID=138851 RepID=A0A975IF59_9SPIR|nr:carbohydrate ABC transporter permease [Treponema parvum]QTQ14593.1 carbohydrate ABC transporter permease [Treponema parvum]
MKKYTFLNNLSIHFFLFLFSLLFLLPYFWMISTSLKTSEQITNFMEIIPDPISVRSFKEGFELVPFFKYIVNTMRIGFLCVLGSMFSCSMAGFGFAKFRGRGKNFLFIILLATMMVPQTVTLIPSYMLYSRLRWVNTIIPLTLPSFFGASAFNIFLMRQFFSSLPNDLAEAALIDGCSWGRIFINIYIPNSVAALMVVAINQLVFVWNDYLSPLVYLGRPSKYTVALGLNMFKGQYGGSIDPGPLMAMACVSIIPLFILYVFFQRYFVEGIAASGIKR